MMNGVRLTTGADVEQAWHDYQMACDKLAEMRLESSTSTELEIQLQLAVTEKLLQQWIHKADFFKTSLN
tara:strand:+ start:8342 stop:8548 length:207 start_codon:yes stop_codon:yes gene_type:complete